MKEKLDGLGTGTEEREEVRVVKFYFTPTYYEESSEKRPEIFKLLQFYEAQNLGNIMTKGRSGPELS